MSGEQAVHCPSERVHQTPGPGHKTTCALHSVTLWRSLPEVLLLCHPPNQRSGEGLGLELGQHSLQVMYLATVFLTPLLAQGVHKFLGRGREPPIPCLPSPGLTPLFSPLTFTKFWEGHPGPRAVDKVKMYREVQFLCSQPELSRAQGRWGGPSGGPPSFLLGSTVSQEGGQPPAPGLSAGSPAGQQLVQPVPCGLHPWDLHFMQGCDPALPLSRAELPSHRLVWAPSHPRQAVQCRSPASPFWWHLGSGWECKSHLCQRCSGARA